MKRHFFIMGLLLSLYGYSSTATEDRCLNIDQRWFSARIEADKSDMEKLSSGCVDMSLNRINRIEDFYQKDLNSPQASKVFTIDENRPANVKVPLPLSFSHEVYCHPETTSIAGLLNYSKQGDEWKKTITLIPASQQNAVRILPQSNDPQTHIMAPQIAEARNNGFCTVTVSHGAAQLPQGKEVRLNNQPLSLIGLTHADATSSAPKKAEEGSDKTSLPFTLNVQCYSGKSTVHDKLVFSVNKNFTEGCHFSPKFM